MRRPEDFPDAHLRVFARPPLPPPEAIRSVYLVGVCGKGMGALAELFAASGRSVRGSDAAAYPPMSTRLAAAGVEVLDGYAAAHLAVAADLTVVGNAAIPTHVEAAAAREAGLVQASFPEALGNVFLTGRRPVVVAGTHGKTTTTGLATHVLRAAGLDPGFLVGGVIVGDEATAGLGTGPHFVVEGDEYDAAYFDKRPKMLLYRPQVAVVTSLEFDHADIYDDVDDYRVAFETFVGLVPQAGGHLVLWGDDPSVRALAAHSAARVTLYGDTPACDVTARDVRPEPGGQRFRIDAFGDSAEAFLPLGGDFNRHNALAVAAVALGEGVALATVAHALGTFRGMARRQEPRGEPGGILVVDDFAHHPTSVEATIRAVRERWADRFEPADGRPGGRLVAVFEPRSNSSRRKVFETRYGEAFGAADRAFLSAPPLRHNDTTDDFLDPAAVVRAIEAHGTPAAAYPSADALLPDLVAALRPGDLVLVMSNGSFDGLVARLVAALAT
ncbi:MAG TPA: Mur ligase family protein [Rubricoccaceae bacterium]|jgi:UDP-N-acetylmuramate: L-alanyl-gamma-D-glutamyl-meso-diaminopimelate ligase